MQDLKNIGKIFTTPLEFINKYFKALVFLVIVLILLLASGDNSDIKEPNLAKLYLTMPLYESESFRAQIEKIKANKNIKGALLIIDSPGGTISASIEIADMIKELNNQMPIIAYVQGAMASGSYYAGMYASDIYANRGAIIGSIGVIFSGFNIAELLNKLGIKEQGLKAGAYKEVGTIMREWSAIERQYLNDFLQEQYKMFWSDVIAARGKKLKSEDYKIFAEGKVFSAKNALNLGLIDNIGSMQEAILALSQKSGVESPVWLKKDRFEDYMDRFLNATMAKIMALSAPSPKAL